VLELCHESGEDMETSDRAGITFSLHSDVLRAADNTFRLTIEASPTGVLVMGPEGTIALVNHALEQQFGYSRDELIGQPVEILLPESVRSTHNEHRLGYARNPQTRPMGAGRELFGRRKDGVHIPVEIGLNAMQTTAGVFVLASVMDVSERQRNQDERLRFLQERLEFERLVARISTTFFNLKAEEIDDAIREALRSIVETLDLDRGSLFQLSGDEDDFLLTHHWARPEERQPPQRVSARDQFPWTLAKIRKGEVVSFSSVEEVQDAVERETVRHYGAKSRLTIPLTIDGKISGVIGFASTRMEREWPEEIVSRLNLVAQVLNSALARKHAEAALRSSEERFRLLADNAAMMIWVSEPGGGCTWVNRQWLEFVGHTMDQELGNGWAASVHPDDLESCFGIYKTALAAREPFDMEYRVRRHDGVWRWVLDKGTPNYAGNGTFEGFIGSSIDVTEQKQAMLQLEGTLVEVQSSREQLRGENVYLRREVQERFGSGPIVGHSAAVHRVLDQIEQVAPTDSTVLLLGETGTGKELFATRIHELSGRCNRTIVRVNCAAIPTTLIESELFGREKGAFTGALARQIGRFELADHSTIFLDEIGDLPLEVQIKLLRVLEERKIERLGSSKEIRIDTRIIAATHRNLEQRIAEGLFREDLFYRLNVFPIYVPPLRDRGQDIPMLVWRFVKEFSGTFGKRIEAISRENMAALQQYPWPGNIRELRNVVERAMIQASGTHLSIALPAPSVAAGKHYVRLDDVEREHIRSVLESTGWRIRGPGGAASRLGFKPTTLETRMAKLGLSRGKPSLSKGAAS
jgi:formate hydrogenlyase transcriptional activator